MTPDSHDLAALLGALAPVLHAGTYVYCVVPPGGDLANLSPVATMVEPEGLTLILPEARALAAGLAVHFRAAWITLTVHSDLQAVGLTAAFAGALAEAGIGCNVVAGAFHDHLFVPVARAEQAMAVLTALQRAAAAPVGR
jgi:hypothetical protein